MIILFYSTYFGARYYDPEVGRFPSIDPLASLALDMTSYHYTHNNPINRIDPTGMFDAGRAMREDPGIDASAEERERYEAQLRRD